MKKSMSTNSSAENRKNSCDWYLKLVKTDAKTNVIRLPSAVVNVHSADTTDFIDFGACWYENPRPTGLNMISPVVRTKYCGTCHRIWTDFTPGVASILSWTNAARMNAVAAKNIPTVIRCNGRRRPIFASNGCNTNSKSGIKIITNNGFANEICSGKIV